MKDGSRLAIEGAIVRNIGDDLDGNGKDDGVDAGVPAFMARLGYTSPGKNPLQLGVWSLWGQEEIDVGLIWHDNYEVWVVGCDWSVPLLKGLNFRASSGADKP